MNTQYVTDYMKSFIEKNIDLIDSNNYTEIYNKLVVERRCELSELLLTCNINPLLYMKIIPPAFLLHCEIVDSIEIPETISVIRTRAFSGSSLQSVTLPKSVQIIGDHAFNTCDQLHTAKLSDVKYVGEAAFKDCTALNTLEFSDCLEVLSLSCFHSCTKLESIRIPRSVKTIEAYAFHNCCLRHVVYEGTTEDFRNIEINPYAFDSGISIQCTNGFIEDWS